MTRLFTLTLFSLLFYTSITQAAEKALIYKGPGSCNEDCSEAAFQVAHLAGLDPVYVSPKETSANIFDHARVWIQPGGVSTTAYAAMDTKLVKNLKKFIKNGGGYVGFCAGAFLAGKDYDPYPALGLIPGATELMGDFSSHTVITKVSWKNSGDRKVYWEGGPHIILQPNSGFQVISRYFNGKVAGVQGPYGQGRVSVVGYHPEAPQWWRDDVRTRDTDGLDFDLAVEMIHWAAKL